MDRNMSCGNSQKQLRGASLLVVLAVLAVLSQLVMAALQLSGDENRFARAMASKKSAQLATLSGIDYLLSRAQSADAPFRTDSLYHQTKHSQVSFDLKVQQKGVWGIWTVQGHFVQGNKTTRDSSTGVLSLLQDSLPVLVLSDPQARLAWSGRTQIKGNIASYLGIAAASTDSRMPAAEGMIHHFGIVLDSSWERWEPLHMDAAKIQEWVFEQLQGREWEELPKLILDQDDPLSDTVLVANEIEIKGAASAGKSILCAKKITVATQGIIDAQLIASDTLLVKHGRSLRGASLVVLNDEGWLDVQEWTGPTVIIYAGNDTRSTRVRLGADVRVEGAVLSNGIVEPGAAVIKGSMVAWNVVSEHQGIRWNGFLNGAQLEKPEKGGGLPLPDLVQGWKQYNIYRGDSP